MKFTKEQYIELGRRFSEKSFLGKVMLIKQNPTLFRLEISDGNLFLRLCDEEMMVLEVDMLFSFPQNLSDKEMRDLMSLIDINLKRI